MTAFPVRSVIAPLLPSPAVPVSKEIIPDPPEVVVPDLNDNKPLGAKSVSPPDAVNNVIDPLVRLTLAPLFILISPPK